MHKNNGACPKCLEIINRYPNFNKDLLSWFTLFQARFHEAHISCAGRGREDQENAYAKNLSKSRWGHSAHNYNCAIDLFCNLPGVDLYSPKWFGSVVAPEIPSYLSWYGAPGSVFPELPHVEVRNWRDLLAGKEVELVEPPIYPD